MMGEAFAQRYGRVMRAMSKCFAPTRAILRSKESVVFALFVVVFSVFALREPNFLLADNLFNVARQYSELAVVSVGLTIVIITGGIDISVGSIVGLTSVLVGIFALRLGLNIWFSCGLAVLAALICGLINGLVVTKARIQPIVATLAMFSAARGLGAGTDGGVLPLGIPGLVRRPRTDGGRAGTTGSPGRTDCRGGRGCRTAEDAPWSGDLRGRRE